MNELNLEAREDNLEEVVQFIDTHLEKHDCSMKAQMQIHLAVEEIFINIAHYAYQMGAGMATVRVEVQDEPLMVIITFVDRGTPYDPLAKADPDTTLSAEEREIGGLGIYLVKKTMDDIDYAYKNGQNILTIRKNL